MVDDDFSASSQREVDQRFAADSGEGIQERKLCRQVSGVRRLEGPHRQFRHRPRYVALLRLIVANLKMFETTIISYYITVTKTTILLQ